MPITSLALFGSRARGDHEAGSDTDLLVVTTDPKPHHLSRGNLSLSFYPLEELMRRAKGGDLFLCHIVKEAIAIYDPEDDLGTIRSVFRLRRSYAREIGQASDLGWLLLRFGAELADMPLVTRRIAWCVRTVLVARSAEQRDPIFSIPALSEFARLPGVQRLIKHKGQDALDPASIEALRAFLESRGNEDPVPDATTANDYVARFEQTENTVALQTLQLIEHAAASAY